jgi:hypothetical protein
MNATFDNSTRSLQPMRLVVRIAAAGLAALFGVGLFVAGHTLGYRQACRDFGIYHATVASEIEAH